MGEREQTRGNVLGFVPKIGQNVNKRGQIETNALHTMEYRSRYALSEKAGRSDYKIMRCKSRIVNLKAIAHGQALIS